MKKIFGFGILMSLAIFGLSGCGSDDRTNNYNTTNVNRTSMNTNGAGNNGALMPNANSENANANRNAAMTDSEFMTEAAVGGMAEVESGKLASTKAQNADVKKFAQMMVTDHTKANDELKALAAKKSATLPTELDAKHKSSMDELKGLSGAEFDKAYVAAQLADHEKTVKLFQTEAQSGTDADIKAFATKTLPTLQSHLEMVRNLHNKMNSQNAGSNANSNMKSANSNMKNMK